MISQPKTYFFCGIGGSGMSALAVIMARRGYRVLGSDRSYDQGQTPGKFKSLEDLGIRLYSQNGSGLTPDVDALIVSSAVENSIPDVAAAQAQGIPIRKRAELLAEIFNESKMGISVAGTSGKTTVTGMIATILAATGSDPTVMNGGMICNFMTNSHEGLANMRAGRGNAFVTETDESDGSIALYNPAVAVLNNVALDHKTMEELDTLFGAFVARASKAAALNFDDARVRGFASRAQVPVYSFSLSDSTATLHATGIKSAAASISFSVVEGDKSYPMTLNVPGRHNVANALAALCAVRAIGVPMGKAVTALAQFTGIKRRLEVIGVKKDITVIDDFGHNPDKISATLKTLKEFPGRLIVMFQPHGFGPLKLMGAQMADVFASLLGKDDLLLMPEAYYAGGTVDRSVTAKDVIAMAKDKGTQAQWFATRAEILPFITKQTRTGDRVVIMGARDDTLSDFAREILENL